ncbi:hypothetical protein IG631_22452 [Alternaria alternata]|nr:hypothetical protein IG631_22452 [Alternaria alternata]
MEDSWSCYDQENAHANCLYSTIESKIFAEARSGKKAVDAESRLLCSDCRGYLRDRAVCGSQQNAG